MRYRAIWAALLCLLRGAEPAWAHYHILLPDKASVERETPIQITLRFGHPFEHQMFATAKPTSFAVLTPDGHSEDLTSALKAYELPGADGKPASGFTCTYTPTRRGDYVVAVQCAPLWMPEEKVFFEDSVKVILHVQTQNGWDRPAGMGLELVPLTRPYGIRAGTVFQAMVRRRTPTVVGHRPVPGSLIEVERYNAAPPKQLPPDEYITRAVKSDPNGVATATLPEPGWWAITAIDDGGTRMREGAAYTVKLRSTLWVPVSEAK